jgi:hypothetical protein
MVSTGFRSQRHGQISATQACRDLPIRASDEALTSAEQPRTTAPNKRRAPAAMAPPKIWSPNRVERLPDKAAPSLPKGQAGDRYSTNTKAVLAARSPGDVHLARGAHPVLARSLLAAGPMQKYPSRSAVLLDPRIFGRLGGSSRGGSSFRFGRYELEAQSWQVCERALSRRAAAAQDSRRSSVVDLPACRAQAARARRVDPGARRAVAGHRRATRVCDRPTGRRDHRRSPQACRR